jgi:Protein of unknown function (DUF3662)/FHA domain
VGVLQRFERRLEGLVEGAFARAFGGQVQPVEVAAALQREAQSAKVIVGHGRVLVPNAYEVELGAADAERFEEFGPALRDELAAMLRDHAAEQGWSFVGPVDVRWVAADDVPAGTVRVRSAVLAAQQVSARTPVGARTAAGRPRLVVVTGMAGSQGPGRSVSITEPVTVLGRGQEADVQVADTGVSRRHAELRLEPVGTRLVDLGSTNGTLINGRRVDDAVLFDGDRLELGATQLVYRQDA